MHATSSCSNLYHSTNFVFCLFYIPIYFYEKPLTKILRSQETISFVSLVFSAFDLERVNTYSWHQCLTIHPALVHKYRILYEGRIFLSRSLLWSIQILCLPYNIINWKRSILWETSLTKHTFDIGSCQRFGFLLHNSSIHKWSPLTPSNVGLDRLFGKVEQHFGLPFLLFSPPQNSTSSFLQEYRQTLELRPLVHQLVSVFV